MRNLAVLSSKISPGKRMQLLPAGSFTTLDGRRLRLNADDAELVLSDNAERKNPMVLDYEHQTLYTERNGQPAPAAGWFKELEFVPQGDHSGLYATDVKLTTKAAQMVEADPPEYGYISAVVELSMLPDGVGAVRKLHHASLTNNPAIDGMNAVAALSLQLNHDPQEHPVSLTEKLVTALALDPASKEADIEAAVAALKQSSEAAQTEIAALKASQSPAADLSKYVPIATFTGLQTEFAALKAQLDERETSALIDQAIAEGKPINASTEQWLRSLAKAHNVAALKEHLDAMPVIAALKGSQTGGTKPAGSAGAAPDADQIAICRAMGITPEAFQRAQAA